MLPPEASDKPQLYVPAGGSVNEVRNVFTLQRHKKARNKGFGRARAQNLVQATGFVLVWAARYGIGSAGCGRLNAP